MVPAFPLQRDIDALRSARPDLLVIGGGIYGAWIACDAAQRGLSVVLVEREDWGAGTSSASSKLIHGGLRYLEHLDFKLVRHALDERRVLSHIAPHLVRPLRFAVPVWSGARVGPLKLRLGLALYDRLAGQGQPVGPSEALSRSAGLRRYPMLRAQGLRTVLSYGDCQEDDARMTLAVVAAAQQAGARVANRVTAEALLNDAQTGVRGARLVDRVTAGRFDLHAGCVVSAVGPWVPELLGGVAPPLRRVKGVHLVMPAIPGCEDAFLLTAPQDGRALFVIPWYGRSLVGTTETEVSAASDSAVGEADMNYLLHAVRHALPELGWTREHVQGCFAGVRTLQAEIGDRLSALTREFAIASPAPRLLQPLGGKYTTARADAVEVVDAVYAVLGRPPPPSQTREQPLPGAPLGRFEAWQANAMRVLRGAGVDAEAARWVTLRHGSRIAQLQALIHSTPRLAERLDPRLPFLRAEVVLAAREEMALSLEDLLRRRLPLTLLAPPDPAAVADAAALMGEVLGWQPSHRVAQYRGLLDGAADARQHAGPHAQFRAPDA